jgi:hypothetical protein
MKMTKRSIFAKNPYAITLSPKPVHIRYSNIPGISGMCGYLLKGHGDGFTNFMSGKLLVREILGKLSRSFVLT